jgi:hypothetical protein
VRVLVDESLPRQIASELPGHEVSTVRQQGWTGLTNGVLLRNAVDAGFQVIVTADQNLRYQQNIPAIGIAVIVLIGTRNRIEDLRPMLPRVLKALGAIEPGHVVEVAS